MTIFRRILRKYYRDSQIGQYCRVMMDESGLAYIAVKENCNPFDLFKEWMEESKTYGKFNVVTFNLATASRSGTVSNRTLVLADYQDGLIFVTNENGKKIEQIRENPNVSACFFWSYEKDQKFIKRQVRMEGTAIQLSNEECLAYYKKEPLFCKIRSHICQQGQRVDWDDLKKKHDDLLKEVKTANKQLPMPEYHEGIIFGRRFKMVQFIASLLLPIPEISLGIHNHTPRVGNLYRVAYKIIPSRFDFYYAWNNYIADRLEFIKQSENGWESHRVAA